MTVDLWAWHRPHVELGHLIRQYETPRITVELPQPSPMTSQPLQDGVNSMRT
jgi:hypothetical protein